MEIADNAAWPQTAHVNGSFMTHGARRTQGNPRASVAAPAETTSEGSLRQLVTMNSWLREALYQQRQISAQLRLLVENAGQILPIPAPVSHDCLAEPVLSAAATSAAQSATCRQNAEARAATLTARQREIMDLVLVGHPNKNIAADLRLSQRTVENHRAAVMKKMGASTLVDLVRIGLAIEGLTFRREDSPANERLRVS